MNKFKKFRAGRRSVIGRDRLGWKCSWCGAWNTGSGKCSDCGRG